MLTPQVPSQSSYANTVARNVRPWKEQAIIIEAIDDYSIEDYIDSLENLIEPSKVCVLLSKISLLFSINSK